MEEKIKIAKILKDKPKGTKLYSPIFGKLRYEDLVPDLGEFTVVTSDNTLAKHSFRSDSRYNRHGEPLMLLPSKEMRDWSKFAWKPGDVLVNSDKDVHIIFEKFVDDAYTKFRGKYYLWEEGGSMVSFEEDENYIQTSDFNKANKEDAQEYIHKIEKILGGKLNRETLEVEKAQPEFKDGDIAFADYGNRQDVFIVSDKTDLSEGYNSFISLDLSGLTLNMGYRTSFFKSDLCKLRLATEEEKQQLFDALAKEGKAWDAKKKMIVDLKPNVDELKPFDKVLVKDNHYGSWEPAIFWEKVDAIDLHPYMVIGGKRYRFCEPYEGNEHLLDN